MMLQQLALIPEHSSDEIDRGLVDKTYRSMGGLDLELAITIIKFTQRIL
jgi:hypothetical protein